MKYNARKEHAPVIGFWAQKEKKILIIHNDIMMSLDVFFFLNYKCNQMERRKENKQIYFNKSIIMTVQNAVKDKETVSGVV